MAVARITVSKTIEVEGQNVIREVEIDLTEATAYAECAALIDIMMNALEEPRNAGRCRNA